MEGSWELLHAEMVRQGWIDPLAEITKPKERYMVELRREGLYTPEIAVKTDTTEKTVENVLSSWRGKLGEDVVPKGRKPTSG